MSGARIVWSDAEAVARGAAEAIALALRGHSSEGPFHLALSGGSTPRRTYELLAALDVPWPLLHVWFGDERCVPPDDADSNFAMARAALFDRVKLAPGAIHRMRGELADRDAAAREYERELPRRFDLMLFGVGPDGHTASLFPGAPSLEEKSRRVVAVVGNKPPPNRLTVTPPVLAAARRVLVLATGAEKAAIVRRALVDDVTAAQCPARLLRDAEWHVDAAAFRETEGKVAASAGDEKSARPTPDGAGASPLRRLSRDPGR